MGGGAFVSPAGLGWVGSQCSHRNKRGWGTLGFYTLGSRRGWGTSVGVPRAEEAGVGEEALRGVDSDSGSFPCMVNLGLLWASPVLVPGVSREHDPP